MKYISKSAVIAYDVCPQKYKLQFIDKIKVELPEALIRGVAAHKQLENYYKNINILDLQRAPRREINRALFNNIDIAEKELIKGMFMYDLTRVIKCMREKKQIVRHFIPMYMELKLKSHELGLVGVMDRVDRLLDGTVGIFDYKTGMKKPISEWNELELMIYYMLFKEKYTHEDTTQLGILYVSHDTPLQKLIPTESLEQEVKEKIENIKDCIEMELFNPPKNPMFCPCEYAKFCFKYKYGKR